MAGENATTTAVKASDESKKQHDDTKQDSPSKWELPGFLKKWLGFMDYLCKDFLGGPRLIKLAHIINLQKGGTIAACLLMMKSSNNYTPTATVYTALHGGYGLCWLLKELVFPDPKWQVKVTAGSALAAIGTILGPYWYIAYCAIVKKSEHSNLSLCFASIVCTLGITLMMGSDGQKYFVLKHEKKLITDGFFSRVRHPNYLGEMMIYGSFAYVSNDIRSWMILGWVWTGLFLPFMLQKEASMSRYNSWISYKKRSGFLIPRLFSARV